MDDFNSELIKAIVHYQQCLEKYTRRNNEPRMLYCISKLYKMPITVEHLEQTGVGRTVNSLRKFNGEVGEAAKSLVAKWKEMVVGEDNDSKDSSIKAESSKTHREDSKSRKHKEGSSSSSHKESDKKNKHESKERNSSSYSNGEESHSKKVKEELKHKKSEEYYKKDKESNHYKHKSSKRKQCSDNSESDDNNYEKARNSNHKHKSSKRRQDSDNSESDDSEHEKFKSNSHKHKSSKHKIEEIASEDESRYKLERDTKDIRKQKLSKRKRDDSDSDEEEYEKVNLKYKKYSEDEASASESEEIEMKSHSHKYQSKHKDESNNLAKEKNKHSSHKSKDKKEKKERVPEHKPKKPDEEHKIKDKQLSKDKVKSSSSEKKEKEESGKKSKQNSSKHHQEKEHKSSKKSSPHSKKGKVTVHANGIGSDSGTSFAEALGMLEPPSSSKANKKKIAIIHPFPIGKLAEFDNSSPDISKPETSDLLVQKRLEPLDINISNLLPEITPNYRPIGNISLDYGQSKNKATAEEEALSAIMYSKISRTKVYSGNKVIYGKVPTLFDLCTHVLQDNIDALEYTGGVPYTILKPVIERANPDQLFMLEHHNPYLIEDTDELWELHCQKQFRTKKRQEMETWRDMYMRCLDEREAKLKALTANIKQSQDKSLPVRQTKLAYVDGHSIVKPPRSIARKQAKHGTAGVEKKPLVTPSSRLSTLATAGAAGQIAVPNPGSRAATAAGSSSAVMKPKKAPLMQKTLAFMKNRLFRR